MATLTVRNVSEETKRALQERAAAHQRSMEAEIRAVLDGAVSRSGDGLLKWIRTAEALQGEFEPPQRAPARDVEEL